MNKIKNIVKKFFSKNLAQTTDTVKDENKKAVLNESELKTDTFVENGIVYSVSFNKEKEPSFVNVEGLQKQIEELHFPERVRGLEVQVIKKGAFEGESCIKKVYVPDSVRVIGTEAFKSCENLKWIELPSELNVINASTFEGCTSLETAVLPYELKRIAQAAFKGCAKLKEAYHYTKTGIGITMTLDKSLREPKLPSGLEYIGANAFEGCSSLSDVYLPVDVTEIRKETFKNCRSLQAVRLHNKVKEIAEEAFAGCDSLGKVRLPNSLTSLSYSAFDDQVKLVCNERLKKRLSALQKEEKKVELAEATHLDIDSKMIPGDTSRFYTDEALNNALDYYETRTPMDGAVENQNSELKLDTPTRYKLENGRYYYNSGKTTAKIMLTGDLMCRFRQIGSAYRAGEGYSFEGWYKYVKPILDQGDLVIGNMESMIAKSFIYSDKASFIDDRVHLNAPDYFAASIKNAGFDLVVNAQNHAYDTGTQGVFETLDVLNRAQLMHTGIFAGQNEKRYISLVVNGFHIAVLAYFDQARQPMKRVNFTKEGLKCLFNTFDQEQIEADVKAAKAEGAEYIIAYSHCGREYTDQISDRQEEFAKMLADAGVDYIFGCHSHCIQPYAEITAEDGRVVPVLYSGGNFYSDMSIKMPYVRDTLVGELVLSRDANGAVKLESEGYHPCLIKHDGRVPGNIVVAPVPKLFNDNDPQAREDLQRIKDTVGHSERFKCLVEESAEIINGAMEEVSEDSLVIRGQKQITIRKICKIMGIPVPKRFVKIQDEINNDIVLGPTALMKKDCIYFYLYNDDENFVSYLKKAKKVKAKAIFVEKSMFESLGLSLRKYPNAILLDDKIEQIGAVYSAIKDSYDLKTVTITGSVGKTTTKQFVSALLKAKFRTYVNAGNLNSYMSTANHIVNKIGNRFDMYVQEVCAGAPGYVRKAAAMLKPDVFVFLNVEAHHMNHYKTFENVFNDKVSLDNYLKDDGIVIANFDDENIAKYPFKHKVISFGINTEKEVDYRAVNIRQNREFVEFDILHKGESRHVKVQILGEFNAYNITAAYIVAKLLNVEEDKIDQAFAGYRNTGVRQNFVNIGGRLLCVDCYNACEASILASAKITDHFPLSDEGEKIAVLGGENKLGDLTVPVHKRIGSALTEIKGVDEYAFLGTSSKKFADIEMLGDAVSMYSGFEEANQDCKGSLITDFETLHGYLKEKLQPGNFLMFKCQLELDATVAIDKILGTSFSYENSYYKENSVKIETKEWKAHTIKTLGETELLEFKAAPTDGAVVIPDTLKGYPVFRLCRNLFRGNTDITTVEFGKTLKNIGRAAFFECTNLKNLVIPSNVLMIESGAFGRCSGLETVRIEEGCLHIAQNCFRNDSMLKEVYIPKSVLNIEAHVFEGCPNVAIYCHKGSFAEQYAIENNLKYFYME